MSDLRTILDRIDFTDDALVQKQLADQHSRVRERLAQIQNIVLVMSGKGGVGKSTVTANLGMALARTGLKVGILDADLNGPSIPHMLGLQDQSWRPNGQQVEPAIGPSGLRVASMGFFLDQDQPVRWDGPTHLSHVWLGMVESGTLREFLGDVHWGQLDVLLVDMPPGAAADKPPAILQFIPDAAGAVFVTTPSKVTISVVRRSVAYANDLGLKILGLVENFADLFGESNAADDCLQKIPYDPDLARSLDTGEPLPANHPAAAMFDNLAAKLMETLR